MSTIITMEHSVEAMYGTLHTHVVLHYAAISAQQYAPHVMEPFLAQIDQHSVACINDFVDARLAEFDDEFEHARDVLFEQSGCVDEDLLEDDEQADLEDLLDNLQRNAESAYGARDEALGIYGDEWYWLGEQEASGRTRIQIFVRTLAGTTITLEISAIDTVSGVVEGSDRGDRGHPARPAARHLRG